MITRRNPAVYTAYTYIYYTGRIYIQVQQSSHGENDSAMEEGSEEESKKQSSCAEKDIFIAQQGKNGISPVSQQA